MKNKLKGSIFLTLALAIFMAGFISAAASMTTPVSDGNYTTPITLTVAYTGIAGGATNFTNVSCWYNASSGLVEESPAYLLVQILNTTVNQTTFTGTGTLTSGVKTYNITCKLYNQDQVLNATLHAERVTIDNTKPVVSITSENTQISQRRQNIITWASSDATSGLQTSAITIVSPDTSRCATVSKSTSSGSYALLDEETSCTGYYTATITETDYSGNSNTANVQFRVTMPDGKFIGEESIAPISDKNKSRQGIIVAVVIIIALLIYFNKKN